MMWKNGEKKMLLEFCATGTLTLWDKNPFKHEFFIRLARAFPFVKNLSVCNIVPPFWQFDQYHRDKDWYSISVYRQKSI
jgi:hypothetical protein